ncbi:hypothetical protein SAMN04487866_1269 [Thermoactinomyces sp. DSM 45891]|uniref:hypothetical protein n=1 Tax=Thermoactinomyces sp. DSM 45891 TaxID=1761907 RepID=UPI000912DD1E|nr:hypothetical protein [Thermoactinomyces sp. DSM 45891]SFX79212.1 hypothetical protein SAMN04487866_1269 [Thermoactinomyces sp. DSM 45891]
MNGLNGVQVVDLYKEIENQEQYIQFSITVSAKDLLEKLADEMVMSNIEFISRDVAMEYLARIRSFVSYELAMEICNEAEYHANAIIQEEGAVHND